MTNYNILVEFSDKSGDERLPKLHKDSLRIGKHASSRQINSRGCQLGNDRFLITLVTLDNSPPYVRRLSTETLTASVSHSLANLVHMRYVFIKTRW